MMLTSVISPAAVLASERPHISYEATLVHPIKAYRVFGTEGKIGKYWSRVKPTGPLQAQLDAALLPEWGNTAANWAEVTIPDGTKIYEGTVSANLSSEP